MTASISTARRANVPRTPCPWPAIAPGVFETPMMAGMREGERDGFRATVPFPPRPGKPVEFAALAQHIRENVMLDGEAIRLDAALRMAAK